MPVGEGNQLVAAQLVENVSLRWHGLPGVAPILRDPASGPRPHEVALVRSHPTGLTPAGPSAWTTMPDDIPPSIPERSVVPPRVSFLGACHGVGSNGAPPTSLNLIGLSHVVASFIYPLPMAGVTLLFAVYDSESLEPSVVRVLRPNGEALLRVDLKPSARPVEPLPPPADDAWLNRGSVLVWIQVQNDVLILQPGVHPVVVGEGAEARRIGDLVFAYLEVPPLTPDQIEAIRLDPRALSAIQLAFACNDCKDAMAVYVGLERMPEQEGKGAVWYQDAPPTFDCSCGRQHFDLSIIRRNLHAYLGTEARALPMGMRDVGALHRQAALRSICGEFFSLLERDAPEEEVHQFIDSNQVLLHVFAPVRVWSKPPITARYRADFAILTTSRELLLVELERPATVLLKKNGGMSAELQKPFDQIRNWLVAITDHRASIMADLRVPGELVTAVRAVVIAGRAFREDASQLRVLALGLSKDDARFMTYDDILLALATLTESLAKRQTASHLCETVDVFRWSHGGSNPRPLECDSSALPAEL
jgi:hypothetical protein